ncbi:hypothetical protein Anas_09633 [Armadillidium nasatum]|uniref:Uncharacterized protein n=1 Tax=Armadillidium nasatum TaxID=96803 RepID=A0A5N5SQ32_9CRUS|nr:hypothetical protein Anas_09633 [Armadillidium nasatum]
MSGHSAEDGVILTEGKSSSYSHEWLLIAKVVDRISLILFTSIFVFSLIDREECKQDDEGERYSPFHVEIIEIVKRWV